VAEDELDPAVDDLARVLAGRPRLLLRQTKAAVNASLEEAYSTSQSFRDADAMMAALGDDESRAATRRYLENRVARGRSWVEADAPGRAADAGGRGPNVPGPEADAPGPGADALDAPGPEADAGGQGAGAP
jgi:hypothetical protein